MTKTEVQPLTTRTRIALAIARGLAASMGHDNLTPGHIVLGLLREGQNPAVAVLERAGIARDALGREIGAVLPPRAPTRPREVALPLSPGEQQVVARASTEAQLRNDEYVGTEHLLLAMLRDASSPVAQVLRRHGLEFEAAVAHLRAIISRHPEPPSAAAAV